VKEMDDEKKTPDEKRKFKWIAPRDGVLRDIYGNFSHASWTLFDVRLRVGQLIPVNDSGSEFVVEERATVTVSWPHAKNLRDMFTSLVASYEATNGEIVPLKLPPDPSVKKD